jgi:electron transport complex protein RnfB
MSETKGRREFILKGLARLIALGALGAGLGALVAKKPREKCISTAFAAAAAPLTTVDYRRHCPCVTSLRREKAVCSRRAALGDSRPAGRRKRSKSRYAPCFAAALLRTGLLKIDMAEKPEKISRREFLKRGARGAGLLAAAAALGGTALSEAKQGATVWQIDPAKCVACETCATACVLTPSATKAVHAFAMCGYCELCFGFFQTQPNGLNTGAENQMCPTNAIKRTFVEDPYYQYVIDEERCIGCGICVKG